jgi:hypothetical protein
MTSSFGLKPFRLTQRSLSALLVVCTFASGASARWDVVSQNVDGLTAVWTVEDVAIDTISIPGATHESTLAIRLDGSLLAGEPGAPGLPAVWKLIGVPSGAGVEVSAISASNVVVKGVPTPIPGLVSDDGTSGGRNEYRINPDAYSELTDPPLAFIEPDGSAQGLDLYRLTVSPARFDPDAGEIAYALKVTVRIRYSGIASRRPARRGGKLPDFWRAAVLNFDQACAWSSFSSQRTARRKPAGEPINPFASGSWLRVMVIEDGIYRISASEITAADSRFQDAPLNRLGMFTGTGKELPVGPTTMYDSSLVTVRPLIADLNNDGKLNGADEILFYGRSLNRWEQKLTGDLSSEYVMNRYTTENVYWLGLVDSLAWHAESIDGTVTVEGLPVVERYPHRIREGEEFRNFNEAGSRGIFAPDGVESGLDWEWDHVNIGDSRSMTLKLTDVAGDTLWFDVGELRNNLSSCAPIQVEIGGEPAIPVDSVRESDFGLRQQYRATIEQVDRIDLPIRLVNTNTQSFCVRADRGVTLLDYYEAQYWRKLKVPENATKFAFSLTPRYEFTPDAPVESRVEGIDRSAQRLFDITNSGLTEVILPPSEGNVTRLQLMRSGIVERQYLLIEDQSWLSPVRMTSVYPHRDLMAHTGGVDWVVVTHEDFLRDAERLAAWRSEHDGLRVAVATTQDIYDQFSWGLYDPAAIRNYLKYVWEDFRTDSLVPEFKYLLLLGDGHYNYRNIKRPRRNDEDPHSDNWVPPYQEGVIMTDDWYGVFEGTHIPQLEIGRITTRTPDESRSAIDKIIAYEQRQDPGAWQNRAILVCDDESNPDLDYAGERFIENCEDIAAVFRPETVVEKIYSVEYALNSQGHKADAAADVIEKWNDGAILLNYVGHGSPTLWAHERLFILGTGLPQLNNRKRLPVLTALTCSAGHFDHPESQAMTEELIVAPNGGIIAAVAATRLSINEGNIPFDIAFLDSLFRSGSRTPRIGDAYWRAKAQYLISGQWKPNARRLNLMGDPALTIALPELPIEVTLSRDTLAALRPVIIVGRVLTPDSSATLTSFNGQALVHLFDSDTHAKYELPIHPQLSQYRWLNYKRTGLPLYRGTAPVVNGRFAIQAILPKEIVYGGTDARVAVQVWNDQIDGSGGLQGVPISSTLDVDTDDDTGPEVVFASADDEGRDDLSMVTPLSDGMEIARGEPLRIWISDPSGVNVTGGIGHRLLVSVEGEDEPLDITDQFSNRSSATVGYADVNLPEDRPVQRIAVRAWDNRNNISADSIVVRLGAREGVNLSNVIAYPNPMTDDVTTFTWTTGGLGNDLADATIRIFTVAGRLVDTVSIADIADGPALVEWRPDRSLANGVYLYQITVRRQSDGEVARVIERLAVLGT